MAASRDVKILYVAADLFRERGFAAVGVDEIGKRAGVTGPAIYRHFKGKDDILGALFDEGMDELFQETAGSFEDPWDELRHVARQHSMQVLQNERVAAIWIHERRALTGEHLRRYHRRARKYVERWIEIVRRCDGEASDEDVLALVYSTIGALNSVTDWPKAIKTEAQVELLADLVVGSVRTLARVAPDSVPRISVEAGVGIYAQDLGAGPPVVLLAGLGLSHPVWERQVRLLSSDHRVVCVDLRGTGRSDKPPGGYDVDRLAEDVCSVLEQLGVEGAAMVGWSFGGQVALRVAITAPTLVARLALVASAGARASRSPRFPFGVAADALETALVGGEQRNRLGFRRRTIASGFVREPSAELLERLLSCQLEMPSWAAVACYRSYLHCDLLDDLTGVADRPVLLICGRDDPVTPVDAVRWVAAQLADAEIVELDDCGHYPLFEAAADFDRALLDFVG